MAAQGMLLSIAFMIILSHCLNGFPSQELPGQKRQLTPEGHNEAKTLKGEIWEGVAHLHSQMKPQHLSHQYRPLTPIHPSLHSILVNMSCLQASIVHLHPWLMQGAPTQSFFLEPIVFISIMGFIPNLSVMLNIMTLKTLNSLMMYY